MPLAHLSNGQEHKLPRSLTGNRPGTNFPMIPEIVIVNADETQRRDLVQILKPQHFRATAFDSLKRLEAYLRKKLCLAVLIDLDNLPADQRFFKNLKRMHPDVCILGLSERPFHPELEEAISRHFFACVSKPVDPDEIFFLLNSIPEQPQLRQRID